MIDTHGKTYNRGVWQLTCLTWQRMCCDRLKIIFKEKKNMCEREKREKEKKNIKPNGFMVKREPNMTNI